MTGSVGPGRRGTQEHLSGAWRTEWGGGGGEGGGGGGARAGPSGGTVFDGPRKQPAVYLL